MKKTPTNLERVNLTNDELARLSAGQFVKLKLTDDEKLRLREINKIREQDRAARFPRLQAEQHDLLNELQAIGLNVQSVSDLISRSENYQPAIQILLKHLWLPYSDITKETIARCLAVPEAEVREAWPKLVEEYKKTPMGIGIKGPGDIERFRLSAKSGLACTLTAAVSESTMNEFINLIKDTDNGESRVILLSVLRKSKSLAAKEAIEYLRQDPDLIKEIASWSK